MIALLPSYVKRNSIVAPNVASNVTTTAAVLKPFHHVLTTSTHPIIKAMLTSLVLDPIGGWKFIGFIYVCSIIHNYKIVIDGD